MSKIILLNGVSSAGKSSIAKALQRLAPRPLLHVQMDSFLEMSPPRYANHADAFLFEPVASDGPREIAITTGPFGARLMAGMRGAVAALASQGLDLVVDEVLLDDALADYRSRLAAFDLRVVGVFVGLDAAEERERLRGDRMLGLARWQHPRVHAGVDYDLTVDTGAARPEDCARTIISAFGL